MAKKTEYPTRNEQGQFIKDESHRRLLALSAAIDEFRANPTAYAQGISGNAPKGKKTMSYSLPPTEDSENWMQIRHEMRRNGAPQGGYPNTSAGNRKKEAAMKIARENLARRSDATWRRHGVDVREVDADEFASIDLPK